MQDGMFPLRQNGCTSLAVALSISFPIMAVLLPILAATLPSCYKAIVKDVGVNRLDAEARKLGGSAFYMGHSFDVFLDLTGANVGDDFARLSRMEGFKWVTSLSLADTRVTDAAVQRIADHPMLSSLNLSGTKITDKGMRSFIKIHKVHSASFVGTDITDAGLEILEKRLDVDPYRLGLIDLTDTKVTEVGIRKLAKAWEGRQINIIYGSSKNPQQISP